MGWECVLQDPTLSEGALGPLANDMYTTSFPNPVVAMDITHCTLDGCYQDENSNQYRLYSKSCEISKFCMHSYPEVLHIEWVPNLLSLAVELGPRLEHSCLSDCLSV